MEPVHIINGRKIYDRVNWKQGLKLTNEWDGTQGTKPLFIDTKGEFWEIEKGGKKYQTAANPEGWTFGNYIKHVTRAMKRRAQQKGATPTIDELFKVFKKKFPEVSDKELRTFSESVMSMNNEQLNILSKSRLPGQHLDHTIPLDKGGLHWWSNVRNRDSLFNLKKGALQPSKLFQNLTNSYSREAQIGTLASDIRLKPGSPFEEKFLARSLGTNFNKWFKTESPVVKKIESYSKGNNIRNVGLGGTALTILDLLTPGDASAKEFQSAIHEGGSWSKAGKTYLSEKKGELTGAVTTAPFVVGATKLPFIGAAMSYAAPAFGLYSLIYAADKADDIFFEGNTKKYLKEHEPGKHIEIGRQLTSIPGDYDFNRGKI